MGWLDFEDKRRLRRIKKALARRGMRIDTDWDWEVHGPHPDMNYEIYVGYAYEEANPKARCVCSSRNLQEVGCEAHRRYYCVAIYPRAVYEIEDESAWHKVCPENRILAGE